MNKYIKVKSDVSLVRDMDSNAIISQNKSEFDKFVKLSQKKYEEKRKFDNMRSDLDSLKQSLICRFVHVFHCSNRAGHRCNCLRYPTFCVY